MRSKFRQVEMMVRASLSLAIALADSGMAATAPPITPAMIEHDVAAHGAKAVVDRLWKERAWDRVEDGIASGASAWIRLVPMLSKGTDAGTSEGLGNSLTKALPKAPAAVLAVIDLSGNSVPRTPAAVCSAAFYEGDGTNIPQYRARAINAVRRVNKPALAAARAECLKHLHDIRP